jgi:serine/threonine protein kinase
VDPARDRSVKLHVCHACHRLQPPQVFCPACGVPLALEAPEFFLGRTLGGHRIDGLLGTGAMGAVYAATKGEPPRHVALKLMVPDEDDPSVVPRFLREARVLGELRHPHIVEVFECATAEWGTPYFTMELLEGRTLREELRDRPQGMPFDEALAHVRQIGAGLLFAHEHGVVHRDLKPENVFLGSSANGSRDRILDFGLAKTVLRPGDTRLTRSGIVLGTPNYLSPEQVHASGIGPHTDQYAFALITAEMLTGRKMRQGLTIGQIVTSEVSRPLPAERLAGIELPRHVPAALARATQPAPGDRFPDVGAFVEALAGPRRGFFGRLFRF